MLDANGGHISISFLDTNGILSTPLMVGIFMS